MIEPPGLIRQLQAANRGSVAYVIGEVDPYAAAGGTSLNVLVGVDVVAGQVHRWYCSDTRIHGEPP